MLPRRSFRLRAAAPLLCAALAACADGPTTLRPEVAPEVAPARSTAAATTTLAVGAAGTGSGSITSQPSGIGCTVTTGALGGTCWGSYTTSSVVTLTATPAAGSTFLGWTGACTGTGTCSVTLDQASTVVASFIPAPAPTTTLAVGAAGTGSGTVASLGAGINCSITAGALGGTCWGAFATGTTVTLVPTAAAGSTFLGWTGACTGTGWCTIAVSQATSVTASFVTTAYNTLAVGVAGNGSGIVNSVDPGIACTITAGALGGQCWGSFASTTSVTLLAYPATGTQFVGWTGACTGASTVCTVSMSAARSVVASFVQVPPSAPLLSQPLGVGAIQAALSWYPQGAPATEYRIEQRTPGGTFVEVTIAPGNTTTYLVGGLTSRTAYEFRIRACNAAGCSSYSNVVSAVTGSIYTVCQDGSIAWRGASAGSGTPVDFIATGQGFTNRCGAAPGYTSSWALQFPPASYGLDRLTVAWYSSDATHTAELANASDVTSGSSTTPSGWPAGSGAFSAAQITAAGAGSWINFKTPASGTAGALWVDFPCGRQLAIGLGTQTGDLTGGIYPYCSIGATHLQHFFVAVGTARTLQIRVTNAAFDLEVCAYKSVGAGLSATMATALACTSYDRPGGAGMNSATIDLPVTPGLFVFSVRSRGSQYGTFDIGAS